MKILILEDVKMRKSFSQEEFPQKTWKYYLWKNLLKKPQKILSRKRFSVSLGFYSKEYWECQQLSCYTNSAAEFCNVKWLKSTLIPIRVLFSKFCNKCETSLCPVALESPLSQSESVRVWLWPSVSLVYYAKEYRGWPGDSCHPNQFSSRILQLNE